MTFFYLIFLAFLLSYLGIEYLLISKRLQKTPLRILVNGTRGKSTTVKIIYEMLRQNGQKVFAKTTGEQPIELFPDGRGQAIARHAPASIIENVQLLYRWTRESPDAIILECMALHPETQSTLAKRIFQPNYILITNIYPDHKEVMGQRIEETAATIFQCISDKSHVFVTTDVAGHLEKRGKLPEKLTVTQPETFQEKFDFIPAQVINQSWSLISALAQQLNIKPEVTHHCYREAWLSVNQGIRTTSPRLQWSFQNLFSVNDPQSAKALIAHNRQNIPEGSRIIVLFNTRSDRPFRTEDFVNLVREEFPSADVWLTGSGKRLGRQLFMRSLSNGSLQLMNHEELLKKLHSGFETPATIYGLGNYYGMQKIVEKIQEMSVEH